MRLLYTVAAILLATACPATAVPASITGVFQGLTQGKSGAYTLGEKCHKTEECMDSLICFRKNSIRHGRCAYTVVDAGKECLVVGERISALNRCSFGLECRDGVCVASSKTYELPKGPGLGDPCFNPILPDKKPAKDAYKLRPNEGIACRANLKCKVNSDDPNGMGRCFPPGGKKYVEAD